MYFSRLNDNMILCSIYITVKMFILYKYLLKLSNTVLEIGCIFERS